MKLTRGAYAAALLFVLCAVALGQNAVGKWSGRVDISGIKIKTPEQQKQMDAMKKMLASMKAVLTLKANHTYHFEASGGPGKPQSEDGTWSQSGKTVTTIDPKGKKQSIVLAANGKSMTAVPGPEDHAPPGIKFVFNRM